MVIINRESLESFQSTLETVDDSWQAEFNLRETVCQSFELIKKAKKHKVSWEKIAEVLKDASGITEGISPESIRQYYFEFTKNPDLLPKKKRKSGQNKKKSKSPTSVSSGSKLEKAKPESLDINQLTESQVSLDIQPIEASTPGIPSPNPEAGSQPVESASDRKAEAKSKKKYGTYYESGNKKAADEFNL